MEHPELVMLNVRVHTDEENGDRHLHLELPEVELIIITPDFPDPERQSDVVVALVNSLPRLLVQVLEDFEAGRGRAEWN